MIEGETNRAIRNASRALIRHAEGLPEPIAELSAATYTEDQVLGDWFPADPFPAPPL
jgi:hypothetical protein